MRVGQRVRIRAASPICSRGGVPADAVGVVICSYTVRSRSAAPERIDVRFSGDTVMWGVAANEFEPVEEALQTA